MKKRLHKWRLIALLGYCRTCSFRLWEPFLSALKPAGEVAQTQYDLMILSTIIMVLVIIVVRLFC